ncbi:hypothetical protein V2A60_009698 [Cordyceps javanica]|uniref:Uncharacterized protein n=1 Tax=Cordyceps javanica TaxID=43265 RepID=A0A545V0K8_9HYPO|nr:hypothetical protein IF1G_06245 [Cordyceps javanica]TQW05545.1 hypothetical protein IF2G_06667 [Cordyceps javanica]
MNWNNGQLARHSRRSYSNDATRQKQYFAQAKRQKVTEPPKRKYNAEDFVPSYLEDLPEKLDRPWIDAKRQKEQKRRVFTLQEVSQTSLQTTQVRENHKCTQRARGPSSTMEQGDISIDAKRRKLLQQSDWSGVELQKPVMISYPETASITTTDIHGIAEANHPGSRPSAPPYRGVMSAAPTLVNEAENIMWKQFVLGPGRPVLAESAEKCGSDTLDNEGTDSRIKFGINTKAVRAPTWNASKPDNASPVPDSRRRPGPTPAPAGPTPPLTISTEVPSMSLFNNPQTTSNNTATVYFREQGDRLEAMTASPTQAKDQLQPPVLEIQHMTSKPESTFHPPSLFVGRLAIRRSGGAGTVAAVTGAVETGQNGSPVDALNKAPSGRVMSRRRRNKRREIGRPDIRALPNIQGDPIEFTP